MPTRERDLNPWGMLPLWRLTQMRLREIARAPGTLFWIFVFPVLMTVALGLAFRAQGVPPLVVGLVEPASQTTDASDHALAAAGFHVVHVTAAEGERRLRSGKVSLLVTEHAGADVVYRFDPMRPEDRLARLAVDEALQRAWGRLDPVASRDRLVVDPGARYVDFLVPGLMGMNVMLGSMWAVAFGLVDLRVRKLLKRLLATPLRRPHLLVSMVLSRALVLPVEIGSLLIFARVAFDVRVQGSLAAVAVLVVLGSLCFGGVAVLVGSRAQNVETASGLMNTVMIPMFVLSGVFFSPAHFPAALQPVIAVLPLSALNESLRAVILDGRTLASVAAPCGVLLAWGVAGYAAGLRLFRWT
jgi:ABC-2 type transport system permease protein